MIFGFDKWMDHRAFLDDKGNCVTYEDLDSISKELESVCEGRCLVACLCKNTIGSAVGYISFLNAGIVPMMLSAGMEDKLRNALIGLYRPMFMWVPADQTEEFPGMTIAYRIYDYVLLRTEYSRKYQLHPDLALLLTTSGSTGSPKFVRQSYKNILSNTKSIVEYLKLDQDERAITTLPMNYTYGLSIINTHLFTGATILMTEYSLMQKEFWNFFKEQEATSFGGVPYTYEMLDRLRFYRMELPSLKTITQAGGKLSPRLHEKFALWAQENNRSFVVMYGQCEATARMGYLPAKMAVEKKGSMGIPIPGGIFLLLDDNDNEIKEPHTVGELVYQGENVTMGYALCPEDLTKGDEWGGILKTGDMAEFDDDGYFYISGRKKRFLKIYGNRVNLDEIEQMLKEHFDFDLACGGIDDHLVIYVTKNEKNKEVLHYVTDMTKLNPAAYKVKYLEVIPKNDAGKVLYKELEKYD